jgi:hypothetical protein
MRNGSRKTKRTPEPQFCFGTGFLLDHAGQIIEDPKVALIELVANAYDAGATRVEVNWPREHGSPLSISDMRGFEATIIASLAQSPTTHIPPFSPHRLKAVRHPSLSNSTTPPRSNSSEICAGPPQRPHCNVV